jgi:hypothetical protein
VSRRGSRFGRIRLRPGSRLSSDSVILVRDPAISFPADKIAKLAERHKIDQVTLDAIVADAACNYRAVQWTTAQGYDRDTLDKVEKPAAELSRLLSDKTNHHRLAAALFEEGGELALRKFCEEMLPLLENVRLAARKAHRPREPGRPKMRVDLDCAYQSLVKWYRRLFGDEAFTNKWHRTDAEGLIPTSDAACFLYDVMKMIDSRRLRLAEELRDLMADTVERRRG